MPAMTSKERVLRTFAFQPVDRIPMDYGANPGIDARLKAHFGLGKDDGEGLLKALGCDFRGVGAGYIGPRLHPERPGVGVDPCWGVRTRWVEHEAGGYWDFCDFPLADADEEAVAAWPMPDPDRFDYAGLADACRRAAPNAVFTGHPGTGDVLNGTGMLRGPEQTLVDLATSDPAGLLLWRRRADVQLEILRRTLEASAGGVDFLWLGEDLGSQRGPLMSLDTYRAHLRPIHERFVALAKSFDIPVMVHTCGASSWVYEDFIEMGIRAVDTLQPEATGMSPAELASRFGGRLAFHGAISTTGAVSFGTPEEVTAQVRETIAILKPTGGYMLAPAHMLQDNSPLANVLALYDAARRFG